MVKKQRQTRHRLGGIALCLFAASCADVSSRSEPVSRLQGTQRVQDLYQNRSPEVVRYDRYTLVSTRPAEAQRDPLNQIVDIRMPAQVVSRVGEGLRYLLLESGYSLCSGDATLYAELFSKSLPAVQRSVGPMRLSDALQVLAGPAWRLHVDDVNREVCFVLRDQYRRFTPTPAPAVVKAPSQITSTAPKPATGQLGNISHNPFRGSSSAASTTVALKPESIPVPSPVLQTSSQHAVGTVTKPAQTSPATPAKPHSETLFSRAPAVEPVKKTETLPQKPTTTLPPAPAAASLKSASHPIPTPVTPAVVTPDAKVWRAEPGTTLKETLVRWASEAKCDTSDHWVVIWPMELNYRIDAPLLFRGAFESALVQLFDLYREAKKPLFVEASRFQCLVSVSDQPKPKTGER